MSSRPYRDRSKADPHRQHYEPIPTLESLDNEGLIQSAEGQAETLYRLDPAHRQQRDPKPEGDQADPTPSTSPSPESDEVDGIEEEQGLFRGTSVDWKRDREESRERKPWWKRPHPTWLLFIQLGQAMSIGMSVAPKSEIYNSLACMIHYPSASSEQPKPAPPPPILPAMPPHPLPSSASSSNDDGLLVTFLASPASPPHHLSSISQKLSAIIGLHSNTSLSAPREIGGVLIDPLKCRKSPEVQSAAARFTTIMTITQGVLAALTTGWWGRASDKYGRTRIMSTAMIGILVSDVVFLLTAKFPLLVPGAYRFLIVGPFIDGLLGGMPTLGATNNAYIADCTPDGTRAQIYSKYMGVMMVGFAIGPIIGTAVIRQTGDILSVFYFSTALHILMLFIAVLILPESLTASAKSLLSIAAAERKRSQSEQELVERRWEEEDDAGDVVGAGTSGWSRLSGMGDAALGGRKGKGRLRRLVKRAFGFLEPLEIFWPKVDEKDPLGSKKNWNLTLLALGNSLLMMVFGVFALKFAYVQLKFGWGPSELGPFLTLMGSIRGLHLLVLLPLVVRYFKPTSPPASSASDSTDAPSTDTPAHPLHDSKFDLIILQSSILVDIVSYILIILSNDGLTFLIASAGTCLGGGAGPAVSSLALALLPSAKHSGRLFGGLAVLQACLSTALGPLLFGIVYSFTTKTFPKLIFVLTIVFLVGAFGCFSLIRLGPKASHLDSESQQQQDREEEEEEQRMEAREQRKERGRDRKVKVRPTEAVGGEDSL